MYFFRTVCGETKIRYYRIAFFFFFRCNVTSTKLNVVLEGQALCFSLYVTSLFSQLVLLHPYFLARRCTFSTEGMNGRKAISAPFLVFVFTIQWIANQVLVNSWRDLFTAMVHRIRYFITL